MFYLAASAPSFIDSGGVMELVEGITISKVAEKLYLHLLRQDPAATAFDTALDWIQASMTEIKWAEAPRADDLKGPIRTCRVYAGEDVNSLSEAGKRAIHNLRALFHGLYGLRSAAAAAAAPVAPAPKTDRLAEEAAVAVTAAVNDTAVAQVGWTHLGYTTPVAGERTPAPLVLQVCGGASMSTTTATLE